MRKRPQKAVRFSQDPTREIFIDRGQLCLFLDIVGELVEPPDRRRPRLLALLKRRARWNARMIADAQDPVGSPFMCLDSVWRLLIVGRKSLRSFDEHVHGGLNILQMPPLVSPERLRRLRKDERSWDRSTKTSAKVWRERCEAYDRLIRLFTSIELTEADFKK